MPPASATIDPWVDAAVSQTPVYDLHTHLYSPEFGSLASWGIDELLTYHYLIAEVLRANPISYEQFWALTLAQRADLVWRTLFLDHAPISEACRGVITVLHKLGLNPNAPDLRGYRDYFAGQKVGDYFDRVFKLANVHSVVMTNDPLDSAERNLWLRGVEPDPRFKAVLRIDPILLGWPNVQNLLSDAGYSASADLGTQTLREIRRFMTEWITRMNAIYVAVSLPPTWRYPDDSPVTRVLQECVLPVTRELNLPLAMMIGVTRQVNPALRMAGDSLGKSDITSVERICSQNPRNKFMVTMLSRENQHELAVTARKQRNMMLFGCWWFVNNPSLIEEITRMRIELLGTRFIPQHSDARVMDQIIYKWQHSRTVIAGVLKQKLADLSAAGWSVTEAQVRQTVRDFFSGNFEQFLAWTPS